MISLIWLKKTNLSQFFFLELEEVDIKKKMDFLMKYLFLIDSSLPSSLIHRRVIGI